MKYQYEYDLNDFNDLMHIQWVAERMEDYEFYGNTNIIRDELLKSITKKNVFYSDCVNRYRDFCRAFDNNPYNYMTGVLDNGEDYIASSCTDHYFVTVEEKGENYTVPIGYMTEKQSRPEKEKLRDLVDRGRNACTEVFDQIDRKSGEALGEIEGYLGSMEMTLPQRKRRIRSDLLIFLLAWVFLLWSIQNHVWFQLTWDGLKTHMKISAVFYGLFSRTKDKKIILSGVIILLMGVRLVFLTMHLYKKHAVISCMEQIVMYGKRLKEMREASNAAEKVLYEPVKRKLEKNSYVPKLSELEALCMSSRDFKYPKKLKPEEYCVYGCTLWKSAVWVLLVNLAAVAIAL